MSESLSTARDRRRLLDRLLDTANLADAVPRLQPELLHRVIERCGLEDCGEIVALATPEQLARVFDLDLWRAAQPGLDERFDAERFGVWLAVLVEVGAAEAAQKLAGMDADLVVNGLVQHARVFDYAAIAPYTTTDGHEMPASDALEDRLTFDVGGYTLAAKRSEAWDAIVAVLTSLESDHPTFFDRVMRRCVELSDSGAEIDGLDDLLADDDQAMFDLEIDRERRREQTGFATPAQARAFLQMAREPRGAADAAVRGDPIARAYFRAVDEAVVPIAPTGARELTAGADPGGGDASEEAAASVVEVLREEGLLGQPPRALLGGGYSDAPPRLGHIQAQLQHLLERDSAAYERRTGELVFLANTLLAGCSIQTRAFTLQEASDAAVAACNLGLENWPAPVADDFLAAHDLIAVFQTGWTMLHRDVCMVAAARLIEVLTVLECGDGEIQAGLDALRRDLTTYWKNGTPWRAREAMDVLAGLDMPAWAGLLALIDECPAIHAVVDAQGTRARSVSATAFAFIAEKAQIAQIRVFLDALPEMLQR